MVRWFVTSTFAVTKAYSMLLTSTLTNTCKYAHKRLKKSLTNVLPLMFHSTSPTRYVSKIFHHEAQTQSIIHPTAAPTHSYRCCCVMPYRPENTSCSGSHALQQNHPHSSILCSNKTAPFGRLRVRPSKSSMAASHYCPIKAVGAMWAIHVTTNSSTVCCISSLRTVKLDLYLKGYDVPSAATYICSEHVYLFNNVTTSQTYGPQELWLAACVLSYKFVIPVEVVESEDNMKDVKGSVIFSF